jgi:anti-anti-sigma regulatory factor
MTFRIERIASGHLVVVLRVSGWIDSENVETLREAIAQETGRVALDLTEVRLVDREAVKFLAIGEANGVELRNCAAYIREWIAREREVGHE